MEGRPTSGFALVVMLTVVMILATVIGAVSAVLYPGDGQAHGSYIVV
jgi:hypothetical protein